MKIPKINIAPIALNYGALNLPYLRASFIPFFPLSFGISMTFALTRFNLLTV